MLGFAAWAVATVAIRLAPTAALRPPLPVAIVALAVSLLGLAALIRLMLRRVARHDRARAIAAFVVPGMLGDGLTTACYAAIFPNLPAGGQGMFGALMLAGYAVMLAVGVADAARREPLQPIEG